MILREYHINQMTYLGTRIQTEDHNEDRTSGSLLWIAGNITVVVQLTAIASVQFTKQ